MPPLPGILIIEDDSSIRELMAEFLNITGYAVQIAPDGAAALALLDSWHPDLIITDINMPVMDGWQFLEAYRQRPGPHVPVIVCAATASFQERALTAGAVAFIAKPFNITDLLQCVQRHLQRSASMV